MENKQRIRALYIAHNLALATFLDGTVKNPWTLMQFVQDIERIKSKNESD